MGESLTSIILMLNPLLKVAISISGMLIDSVRSDCLSK